MTVTTEARIGLALAIVVAVIGIVVLLVRSINDFTPQRCEARQQNWLAKCAIHRPMKECEVDYEKIKVTQCK